MSINSKTSQGLVPFHNNITFTLRNADTSFSINTPEFTTNITILTLRVMQIFLYTFHIKIIQILQ